MWDGLWLSLLGSAQQIGCVPWRCGGVHATSSTGAGGEGEMGIRMYNGAFLVLLHAPSAGSHTWWTVRAKNATREPPPAPVECAPCASACSSSLEKIQSTPHATCKNPEPSEEQKWQDAHDCMSMFHVQLAWAHTRHRHATPTARHTSVGVMRIRICCVGAGDLRRRRRRDGGTERPGGLR